MSRLSKMLSESQSTYTRICPYGTLGVTRCSEQPSLDVAMKEIGERGSSKALRKRSELGPSSDRLTPLTMCA